MAGTPPGESEFLEEYERIWINEGYLSREHEELRKKAGREALLRFYRREQASGTVPAFLEKSFKWQEGKVKFIGRWDRVDMRDHGAVIIDFKAAEVKNQKEADRKTGESLQMGLYALSFVKTQSLPLLETQLYFLESDIIGRASQEEKKLERAMEKIQEAEDGIRSQNFRAKPDWHNCSYCEFKTFCPYTYAY